jgi:integrase
MRDRLPLSTPAKRGRLPVSKSPVWVSADNEGRGGVKLGYRKGARGGSWVAKLVERGRRAETTLGIADDDGAVSAMSYREASEAARAWGKAERERIASGAATEAATRPATVGDAIIEYMTARAKRDPVNGRNAGHRLGRHVLADRILTSVQLHRLIERDLAAWRARLPDDLAPATVNRMLNDVRAALNAHIDRNWRVLPAWLKKEVKAGTRAAPNVQRARQALLNDADVRRVIDATYGVDEDLGNLVLVLASTGARFRQVSQIRVTDVQAEAERIMVPVSFKGRGVKQRQQVPVAVLSDVVARLRPLLAGRAGHEALLQHWVGVKGFGHADGPVRREPWRSSNQMFKGWVRALAAAGVEYVEPYALRHSSVVRMLRAGVPVRIVAAAHDTSSQMIERHYAQFILDAADELARRALTPLVSAPPRALSAIAYASMRSRT